MTNLLGALDDKIDLNQRMNQTLEAIALAIFKAWFSDASWPTEPLAQNFHLTMGQSPPGETYNEVGLGLPFFQGRIDFGFRFPRTRVYCSAPARFANKGDTLLSVRAPVGDMNMALERSCIGRGIAALRHRTGSESYTYYSLRSLREVLREFEAEGTVFGAITKANLATIPCIAAPDSLVVKFDETVSPIDDAIETNDRESATLTSLRDALLPRLIEGGFRLGSAESQGLPTSR